MKYKGLYLSIALLMIFAIPISPIAAQETYGPHADYLIIHLYENEDAEFEAFDACDLDIIDWALTEYWINEWSGRTDITMRAFAGGGKREFDLNNQRWPTGVTLPRTWDPVTETYKHYSNYADAKEQKARDFRRAIACLADKDGYISRILKGLAYRMDTGVPTPYCAGYVNLDVSGVNYPYNFDPYQAAAYFDGAGFVEGTTANPYYPVTPEGWEAEYIRIDPEGDHSVGGAGTDLLPIIFYGRLDDSLRSDAAVELTDMLRKSGIPMDLRIVERAECSSNVMDLYDYHIYTGGWGLGTIPTWLYYLYHSEMYYGGTATDYYGGVAGSLNYPGYCSATHDVTAATIITTTDQASFKQAIMDQQEIYVDDCPVVDLWAAAAFEAYKSKWTGACNMEGFGTDNVWGLFNMRCDTDDTMDWGFKSNLEGPDIINSRWTWDRTIVGVVYDGLIAVNPYNFAIGAEVGILCDLLNPYTIGDWDGGSKTKVTYHLRNDVKFHSGRDMTPYDVAFSHVFLRDCGPGVYWYAASAAYTHHVALNPAWVPSSGETGYHADIVADASVPMWDAVFYMTQASLVGHRQMPQYIMDSYIWLAGDARWGWGFGDASPMPNRFDILNYDNWEMDADENGIIDMYEDGSGYYEMTGNSGGAAEGWTWVSFEAFRQHYWSWTEVENFLNLAFHWIGNVNYDGSCWEGTYTGKPHGLDMMITMVDGSYIQRAWFSTSSWPEGTSWSQWNEDCDFDYSDRVYTSDLFLWGSNYGRYAG